MFLFVRERAAFTALEGRFPFLDLRFPFETFAHILSPFGYQAIDAGVYF